MKNNHLFCCLALVLPLLLAAGSAAAPPQAKSKDSVEAITQKVKEVGSRFVSKKKHTRDELYSMQATLTYLRDRSRRLHGPEAREVERLIVSFKELLQKKMVEEAEERRNKDYTKEPYVFRYISAPDIDQGGRTEKGLKYLAWQVDQFGKEYRKRQKDKFSGAESLADHSRHFFEREIESSVETAERRIKKPKDPNVTYIASGGGIVLDNYSPQENLQWALNVARIAVMFESRVGGNARQWRDWQRKIIQVATQNKLKIK